jgi:adenylate cyclase
MDRTRRALSRSRARRATLRAALLIGLIPGLAGVFFSHWPPTENLERGGLDLLFLIRGVVAPPEEVCVVALDDDSAQELGLNPALPYPRSLHARLIRTLKAEGARAVAFDMLFDTPRDEEEDEALRSALSDAGIVVLGSTVSQVNDPRFRKAQIDEPYAPFAQAAAAVADVNFPTDRDGVIRTAWLLHQERKTLALAATEIATGRPFRKDTSERLIVYYGPPRTIPTVSLYQALDPGQYLRPGYFRDKVVFVGLSQPSAPGIAPKDAFPTPFRGASGEPTYGVEIHATLAGNLLEGRRIDLLPPAAEAALLLLFPLAASLAFVGLRPLWGGVAFLALELLPLGAGYLAFTSGHTWIPVVIPSVLQLPATYVLSLVWYYLTTVRERERIKRAFSFYLSPDMIKRIAADPDSLNLGGEEVVATALFTDIKGFTPLAEGLSAPETASLLNRYFSEVTGHIFEAGGTLIKYIGDAVFAIWGAPLRMEDHATQACRAALAMARQQRVSGDDADPVGKLITRIGVHTGAMLVGNLGSSQRFDYTAIGDAVNLASRLEGLNKAFGTLALVSGETLAKTDGRFAVRPLGRARVVGRSEPVEIFELLGLQSEDPPMSEAVLSRFTQARVEFCQGRFSQAAEGFREVLSLSGGKDGPSELYLNLCADFEKNPPGSGWDGIINFESK